MEKVCFVYNFAAKKPNNILLSDKSKHTIQNFTCTYFRYSITFYSCSFLQNCPLDFATEDYEEF